jgi:hypothetical protein
VWLRFMSVLGRLAPCVALRKLNRLIQVFSRSRIYLRIGASSASIFHKDHDLLLD